MERGAKEALQIIAELESGAQVKKAKAH